MTTFLKIAISFFIIFLLSCNTQPHNTSSLIAKDTTNKNEKKNTLFVFVGEKIEVEQLPSKPNDFDNVFKAKYKILQRVYGNYSKGNIDFLVYDHNGIPPFSKHKNVLLFVSEEEGKYYHEKYMYNDVYKTKNGRWAGSFSDDYEHSYNKHTTVKPEIIEFVEEVSYPTRIKDDQGREIEFSFPEPYFEIVDNKAIVVYGNYIEDLFKLKKEGVLSARELFGTKKFEIQEIKLMDIKDTTHNK